MTTNKSLRKSVLIAATSVVAGGLGAGYLIVGPMASADTAQVAEAGSSGTTGASGATAGPGGRVAHLQSVLAPLVADGTITQGQADKVIAAIDAAPKGPRHGGMRKGAKISLEVAATAIGITESDLRSELRSGKSIAQVASAKGVEIQTVVDALVAAATQRIDEAVSSGKLTAAQAETMKGSLAERITDRVNSVRPEGGRRRGGGRHAGPATNPGTVGGNTANGAAGTNV